MAKQKKPATMGPVRQNLEAFGVAILAAVLLKWFCIEAYQIPTSSMQPTLMGSTEADVYDRILVDKLIQTFREPQRWDITVFKYPLQKNQKYVKRIVGMPNDRLYIAGGNVYQTEGDGDARTFVPIRKPDDLQACMWKNVYPARRLARAETKALPRIFGASPSRAAEETDGGFALDPGGSTARLFFRDAEDGGMIDRVWDGYPEEVARAIRNDVQHQRPQEIVPDVRIAATVTAPAGMQELALEIEVLRPGHDERTFALVAAGGRATLQVRGKGDEVLAETQPFEFALPAGEPTEVAFAHVDDRLIAWHGGDEVQRLDTDAWAISEGCVLPFDPTKGLEIPANQKVIPQFVCKGSGAVRLDDVRIDRDQHYTRDGAPEVIEVPAGHYYMMGDNTLQSVDSRGWTAITIGVDANDNVVPPDSPDAVRTIRGNKRPMRLSNPPDRDETPIPIPSEDVIVMIDEYGEILRLNAEVGSDWPERVSFRRPGAGDGTDEWTAPDTTNAKGISFVPREDIEGRALMVFYPSRPLSWIFRNAWPGRFGLVR